MYEGRVGRGLDASIIMKEEFLSGRATALLHVVAIACPHDEDAWSAIPFFFIVSLFASRPSDILLLPCATVSLSCFPSSCSPCSDRETRNLLVTKRKKPLFLPINDVIGSFSGRQVLVLEEIRVQREKQELVHSRSRWHIPVSFSFSLSLPMSISYFSAASPPSHDPCLSSSRAGRREIVSLIHLH